MQLHPGAVLVLTSGNGRVVGRVTVSAAGDDLVLGKLAPGPEFPAVENLFRELQEAAEQQMLSIADKIGQTIDAPGWQLRAADGSAVLAVHDVQVMNGQDFSCRLLHPAALPPVG